MEGAEALGVPQIISVIKGKTEQCEHHVFLNKDILFELLEQ